MSHYKSLAKLLYNGEDQTYLQKTIYNNNDDDDDQDENQSTCGVELIRDLF